MQAVEYRHGDVYLQSISPVDLTDRKEVQRGAAGLVLRLGTAAGNSHLIADQGAKLYEPGDVDGTRVLVVDQAVSLTHAEHQTINLPPGTYRVAVARQGDDESWNDVED